MPAALTDQLEAIAAAAAEIATADAARLAQLKVELLGRKAGRLTAVLRSLASLPEDERRRVGQAANRLRAELEAAFAAREAALAAAERGSDAADRTMPGRARWMGRRHPVTVVADEICDIFRDLGFVRDGELYVTGRLKDMIIIRGRNLYPQDIEATAVESHEALQMDACAAFSMEVAGREELGIAMEVRRSGRQRVVPDDGFEAVRGAIAEHFGGGHLRRRLRRLSRRRRGILLEAQPRRDAKDSRRAGQVFPSSPRERRVHLRS